jgi:hypothetical protein
MQEYVNAERDEASITEQTSQRDTSSVVPAAIGTASGDSEAKEGDNSTTVQVDEYGAAQKLLGKEQAAVSLAKQNENPAPPEQGTMNAAQVG